MKKLWSESIMQLLQQAADIILLNIVWLLFSLPVFTIGASTTAMHVVARSAMSGGGTSVISSFWEAFTSHFLPRASAGMLIGAGWALLALDLGILSQTDISLRPILFGLLLFCGIVLILIASCLFPLLSIRDMGAISSIRFAFFFSFRHLPQTALATVVNSVPLLLFFFAPPLFLFLIPLWAICYFSVSSCISIRLLCPLLKRYFPANTNGMDEAPKSDESAN